MCVVSRAVWNLSSSISKTDMLRHIDVLPLGTVNFSLHRCPYRSGSLSKRYPLDRMIKAAITWTWLVCPFCAENSLTFGNSSHLVDLTSWWMCTGEGNLSICLQIMRGMLWDIWAFEDRKVRLRLYPVVLQFPKCTVVRRFDRMYVFEE